MKDNHLMLGYESFKDFFNTVFGLKFSSLNIMIGGLATVTSFITNYIYDDYHAVFILMALILLDAFTGIFRAIKNSNFSSSRLPRIFVITVLYTSLLAIAWNLAKFSPFYVWLPSVLYGGFISTLLISIFENSHELNLVPDNIYFYLKGKIDILQSFVFGNKFNKEKVLHEPSIIFQRNVAGDCVYASPNWTKISGAENEIEALGKGWQNYIHPDDIERVKKSWDKAIKSKQNITFEYRYGTKENPIPVKCIANVLRDSEGQFIGFLGTIELL